MVLFSWRLVKIRRRALPVFRQVVEPVVSPLGSRQASYQTTSREIKLCVLIQRSISPIMSCAHPMKGDPVANNESARPTLLHRPRSMRHGDSGNSVNPIARRSSTAPRFVSRTSTTSRSPLASIASPSRRSAGQSTFDDTTQGPTVTTPFPLCAVMYPRILPFISMTLQNCGAKEYLRSRKYQRFALKECLSRSIMADKSCDRNARTC